MSLEFDYRFVEHAATPAVTDETAKPVTQHEPLTKQQQEDHELVESLIGSEK